jgi:hypothetical protein
MNSPYSCQWKEFNREPIFEVLRDKEPWNDDLPIGAKLHFSFGVRKARAILHAESVIRSYVDSKGAEPRINTEVNLGYVPNTRISELKISKFDSFDNAQGHRVDRSYLKLDMGEDSLAFGYTKAEALLTLRDDIGRFVAQFGR